MANLGLFKDAPRSCHGSHRVAGGSMGLVTPSDFWVGGFSPAQTEWPQSTRDGLDGRILTKPSLGQGPGGSGCLGRWGIGNGRPRSWGWKRRLGGDRALR